MKDLTPATPDGLAALIQSAQATRSILSDPDHYATTLHALLNGKRVKAADAEVVVAALLQCAVDFQWQAKRYAHGRSTYAVGMTNDATALLLALGVHLSPTDGTVWAKDGMFGWPNYAQRGPLHNPEKDGA